MELLLVSYKICPYVQRVAFLLEEANVSYKRKYVNPYKEKPDWFRSLSPTGKVPLLETEGKVLFESSVILEYLNETLEGRYLPKDPFQRALTRYWMRNVERLHDQLNRLFSAPSELDYSKEADTFAAKITPFSQYLAEVAAEEVEQPSLLSFSYVPLLYVIQLLEKICALPILPENTILPEWVATMTGRETFKRTVHADYNSEVAEFFIAKNSFLSACTERHFSKTATAVSGSRTL